MGKRSCALDLEWEVSKGMKFVCFEDLLCLGCSREKTSVVIDELLFGKTMSSVIKNLLEGKVYCNIGNKRKNSKICVNKLSLNGNNIIYMYYIDDISITIKLTYIYICVKLALIKYVCLYINVRYT